MVTHHVYPKRRITVIRVSGKVGGSDCQRTFDAIRRDPDFSPDTDWVLVAMDREVMTPELAAELVARLLAMQLPSGDAPKCAIVVRGAGAQETLAPFFDARTRRRMSARTFSSESAAMDWAGWSMADKLKQRDAGPAGA